MKFSTRTTYGLRAMIRLAENKNKTNISLPVIAREENISLGYLEKIFTRLKKAKLIKAEKGTAGGYRLSKKADQIDILKIINALEGKIPLFYCLDKEGKVYCSRKCRCGVTSVLARIQQTMNSTLKNIKLSELI